MRSRPSPMRLRLLPVLLAVLVGGLMVAGALAPPVRGSNLPHVGPSGMPARPTAAASALDATPSRMSAISTAPFGAVVSSPLLNYNTTWPRNFASSVRNWGVGPGAYVGPTGDLWLADNLTRALPGPLPAFAPAIRYNPTTNAFDGIVPQLTNTSALVYDPQHGILYGTNPSNSTVSVFAPGIDSWVHPAIPVGTDPVALALAPTNDTLFVANKGSNNLTVISLVNQTTVVASIPTASQPDSLAFDRANSRMFLACAGSSFLYAVNVATYAITRAIPLTGNPGEVAVSNAAGTVAVTVPSTGFATIANATSFAVLPAIITIGTGSRAVLSNAPIGDRFVFADTSANSLVTVNASTAAVVNSSVPVGREPTTLFSVNRTGMIYSWSGVDRNLSPVVPDTGIASPASPSLGAIPVATTYDSATNRLFVADSLTNSVSALSAATFLPVLPLVHLPGQPYALADAAVGPTVYAGLNNSIVAIDPHSGAIVGSATAAGGVNAPLLVDSADGVLWDRNNVSGLTAYWLSNLTLAHTSGVGAGLAGTESMALDPATDQLYVIVPGGGGTRVAVVNAADGTVVNPGIDAGVSLTSLAFDRADGAVYALGQNLTMINATNLAVLGGAISLPAHTTTGGSVAYDPSRRFLYATTPTDLVSPGQLTVVDGSSTTASSGTTATISVGFAPTALLPVGLPGSNHSASGILIVADPDAGTLGVVATSPPRVDFFTASPQAIDLGQSTQFILQYSGGAGPSTVTYTGLPSGCTSQNALRLECTPSVAGNFTVQANLTDSFGSSALAATPLRVVAALALDASFSAITFPELDVGYSFQATANVTNGSPPYNDTWTFGDGTSASGPSVAHAFGAAGSYVIALTVTDGLGGRGWGAWAVSVNPPPTLTVVASGLVADVNHSLSFSSTVSGGTGSGATVWSFGDGATRTGTTVTHSWTLPGSYSVHAAYTDALGLGADSSVAIQVNPSLIGQFSVSETIPNAPPVVGEPLVFVANPTGGTTPYTVTWQFGDGSRAEGTSVTHVYGAPGDYAVNVTVTDPTGASLNGTLSARVAAAPSGSSTSSSLSFPLGVFLGLLVGAVIAAVVVFAIGPRRPRERPPPPSPYVPPGTPEWKED